MNAANRTRSDLPSRTEPKWISLYIPQAARIAVANAKTEREAVAIILAHYGVLETSLYLVGEIFQSVEEFVHFRCSNPRAIGKQIKAAVARFESEAKAAGFTITASIDVFNRRTGDLEVLKRIG